MISAHVYGLSAFMLQTILIGAEVKYPWLTDNLRLGITISRVEQNNAECVSIVFHPHVVHLFESELRAYANLTSNLISYIATLDIPSVHTVSGSMTTELMLSSHKTPSAKRWLIEQGWANSRAA